MGTYSFRQATSVESEAFTVDTDVVDGVTNSLDINGDSHVGVYVNSISGAHANHIVIIQCSVDKTNWFDSSITVTGLGSAEGTTVCQHIRAKVTTAEGAASSSNVTLSAK